MRLAGCVHDDFFSTSGAVPLSRSCIKARRWKLKDQSKWPVQNKRRQQRRTSQRQPPPLRENGRFPICRDPCARPCGKKAPQSRVRKEKPPSEAKRRIRGISILVAAAVVPPFQRRLVIVSRVATVSGVAGGRSSPQAGLTTVFEIVRLTTILQ